MFHLRYFFLTSFLVATLGAGCQWFQPLASPHISDPILPPDARPVLAQEQGFGKLPLLPPPLLKPGIQGSVVLGVPLPSLPPRVTVLRIPSGRPNATELQNIAGAARVPSGTVGQIPDAKDLRLEWKNEDGLSWSYLSNHRQLDMTDTRYAAPSLTVARWPERRLLVETVARFMDAHGIDHRKYTDPGVDPDWERWWEQQELNGHCMSQESLDEVRNISASLTRLQSGPPSLPRASDVSCVNAEFPSRILIHMDATQDGQTILQRDGSFKRAATLVVDANSLRIISARFYLTTDPERSDYPAISKDDASALLATGGLGGTPRGSVTLTRMDFGWLSQDSQDASNTTYLYPALIGYGTITFDNGSEGPYRIVVPLVKTE